MNAMSVGRDRRSGNVGVRRHRLGRHDFWDNHMSEMAATIERKLDELRSDYEAVTGSTFSHFYCPILFQDDATKLCKAHIVNQAFAESSRAWTVQRTDIDGFYGSMFEADFVTIQDWNHTPDEIIADPSLSQRLRPEILLGGDVVQHFVACGPVPNHFTEALASGGVRLGLKIRPDDAAAAMSKGCEMKLGKDARLPALASLLKAAHLTLFDLLGYRYALSTGGRYLGRTILGEFFLQNEGLSKAEVIKNAVSHFSQYANMVRPLNDAPIKVLGTASDGLFLACFCEPQTLWAYVVFIRTSDRLHGVLVPILEEPSAVVRFMDFLKVGGGPIRANCCRLVGDKFTLKEQPDILEWPESEFL